MTKKDKNESGFLKRIRFMLQRDKISANFPPLAEDEKRGLIVYDDGYVGAVWMCVPLVGYDPEIIEMLRSGLENDFPDESIIQINHISSTFIDDHLDHYQFQRRTLLSADNGLRDEQKNVLKRLTDKRVDHFRKGKSQPLIPSSGIVNKTSYIVVSMKCKCPNINDEDELNFIGALSDSVQTMLKTINMFPKRLNRAYYRDLISSILNMGDDTREHYDDKKTIANQIADFETDIRIKKDGLKINNNFVKSLSVKRMPDKASLATMDRLIGDYLGGPSQIGEPFMLTTTLFYPKRDKTIAKFKKSQSAINYQVNGPLAKMVPALVPKAKGLSVMEDSLQEGRRPCKATIHLAIFGKDEIKVRDAASSAKTFYQVSGFTMKEDGKFSFPAFLHNLPGFCNHEYQFTSSRFNTMTTKECALLLPILGDWPGTGTGASNLFISRRGSMMLQDPFDSHDNLNAIIAAMSGSGKSFLANDIIMGNLSKGAKVRIIDQGRSYLKLCQAFDGEFIEFTENTKLCLNPFTKIRNLNEEMQSLLIMLAKMCNPKKGFTSWEDAKMEECIGIMWEKYREKSDTTVLQEVIIDMAEKEKEQRLFDLATQLRPYTRHGRYGDYFTGKNNLDWDNNLVILELDDLKNQKDLQSVVLIQLVNQITVEFYLGDKSVPKMFILDEAWDLFDDPVIAKFLEGAYRRFRKANANCTIITQSLWDLYDSPCGRAISENANTTYLLKQSKATIAALREAKKLGPSDFIYDLLQSVKTVKGEYSECLFVTGTGIGLGRLSVDRFTQLMYSTDAKEFSSIESITKEGYEIADAIELYMEAEGTLEKGTVSKRERKAA